MSGSDEGPPRDRRAGDVINIAVASAGDDQLFRILVQGIVDFAIFLLDVDGRITTWNAGARRIKGYTPEEIIGQHVSRFYTEEDRAAGLPQLALHTAAETGRFEHEGWRVRRDGGHFWAAVVIDAIHDEYGGLIGFAKITRDLTEKRRAEEAAERAGATLAQSQKMEAVGQLTGGIAHDFNNLLTVITNALDLLSSPARDGAQKRRIIDSAQRAAEHGARLTQRLLVFARRQQLRPKVHDLNALITGFASVLRRACPEPVTFALSLAATPLSANVDAGQFETALLNLVVNATDAMPHNGSVEIATSAETIGALRAQAMSDIPPDDYVAVSVRDSGEGMPAAVQARAFEPFFTTKEVGKGSGLGLSQVYGFVRLSGGHVAIDSAPGAGSTLTLYLPAVAVACQPTAGKYERQALAGRVLVVEDDPEVLEVTVESLRSVGYEVLTAPDGPSALTVLRGDHQIDILFSDIVMPRGMDGVELARAAIRLRPQLRVLLASGYPMAALSTTTTGVPGGSEFPFLSKPYHGSELAEALRALGPARDLCPCDGGSTPGS